MSLSFSIKDLENICGIKAHTIRIWEKRYHLLTPSRTDTNIRNYDQKSLKRLLDVSFLVQCGYKISRVAKFSEEEIIAFTKNINVNDSISKKAIIDFKMAILNYDEATFHKIYKTVSEKIDFKSILYTLFLPLLNEVGMLWKMQTLDNAHEHFITYLIKQKIAVSIEALQFLPKKNNNTLYVLFLPEGEPCELELYILYYLVNAAHLHCLFLGVGISFNEIEKIYKLKKQKVVFVTHFTLSKHGASQLETPKYIQEFLQEFCPTNSQNELWATGVQTTKYNLENTSNFKSIDAFKAFEKQLKDQKNV